MIAVIWWWVAQRVRPRSAEEADEAAATSGEMFCQSPNPVTILIAFTVIIVVILLAGHHV